MLHGAFDMGAEAGHMVKYFFSLDYRKEWKAMWLWSEWMYGASNLTSIIDSTPVLLL